jgi:hypothetical protein
LKITLTLSSLCDVIHCPKLVVAKSSVLIKNKRFLGTSPGDLDSVNMAGLYPGNLWEGVEKTLKRTMRSDVLVRAGSFWLCHSLSEHFVFRHFYLV